MNNHAMRAKMKCSSVEPSGDGELLKFHAVAKSDAYPADGSDEDNSYARWSPSADLNINVQNPALKGAITSGDTFYVDFLRAGQPAVQAPMLSETDAGIVADKELRRDIDVQLQKLKALPKSRERALSITKLQEAIMWLGMDLKALNDTRPYPSSYDPSNTKVEPTADGLKL